jgi:hypothetical protein
MDVSASSRKCATSPLLERQQAPQTTTAEVQVRLASEEAGCRRRVLGSRLEPGFGRLRSLVTAHRQGNGRVPIFPLHKLRRCVGV